MAVARRLLMAVVAAGFGAAYTGYALLVPVWNNRPSPAGGALVIVVTTLALLGYSRRRELAAADRAVEVTGNPIALARALQALERASEPDVGPVDAAVVQGERQQLVSAPVDSPADGRPYRPPSRAGGGQAVGSAAVTAVERGVVGGPTLDQRLPRHCWPGRTVSERPEDGIRRVTPVPGRQDSTNRWE